MPLGLMRPMGPSGNFTEGLRPDFTLVFTFMLGSFVPFGLEILHSPCQQSASRDHYVFRNSTIRAQSPTIQ